MVTRSSMVVVSVVLVCGCNLGVYGEDNGNGPDASDPTARYHPTDFSAPTVHGPEFMLQQQKCQSCHGDDLAGNTTTAGSATSCDSCHTPSAPQAWRSDCTFCHGGEADDTGAPPRNIDGTLEAGAGTFPAHTAHVNPSGNAVGFDCVQCHVKASDVLSLGHAIDETPGVAEVDMGSGLSGLAIYDRQTGCQDVYCHGDGRGDNGVITADAPAMTCEGCHPNQASGANKWGEMSGSHALHLGVADIACGECHDQTSLDGDSIVDLAMHINGTRDVSIGEPGFSFDADTMTCTGNCHTRDHQTLIWVRANGRFHPDNYGEAGAHGPEMELQRMNCRGCHGSDLDGQGAAPSCDTCHDPDDPTAWRSDCTFCHGGDETAGGAPPKDLGAGMAATSLSFRAHTVHVTEGISAALDCATCHTTPTDVLSNNHAFDSTPRVAEVSFSGLATNASYAAGTCSNLYCHGNGRANGTITDGSPARGCTSCHAGINSNSNAWGQMSGEHKKHLEENNVDCGNCHESVTVNGTQVISPLLHVNGQNEIQFSEGNVTWDPANRRCTGSCHGENHGNDRW